jgi:hypothetical protein
MSGSVPVFFIPCFFSGPWRSYSGDSLRLRWIYKGFSRRHTRRPQAVSVPLRRSHSTPQCHVRRQHLHRTRRKFLWFATGGAEVHCVGVREQRRFHRAYAGIQIVPIWHRDAHVLLSAHLSDAPIAVALDDRAFEAEGAAAATHANR